MRRYPLGTRGLSIEVYADLSTMQRVDADKQLTTLDGGGSEAVGKSGGGARREGRKEDDER